jgi:hypothetical protein
MRWSAQPGRESAFMNRLRKLGLINYDAANGVQVQGSLLKCRGPRLASVPESHSSGKTIKARKSGFYWICSTKPAAIFIATSPGHELLAMIDSLT